MLCDDSFTPLPRGFKLVDGKILVAATGKKLPASECSESLLYGVGLGQPAVTSWAGS